MIQRHNSDLDVDERFTRESNRLLERDLERIANAYRELLQAIGEDVDRDGLQRTPDRAGRALEFLTQGYRQNLDEIINGAVFESSASEIILVKDIELYSLCEHHLLPFIGRAHVAYLPNGKVIGLSKVARIVDVFARRLQIPRQFSTTVRTGEETNLAGTQSLIRLRARRAKIDRVAKTMTGSRSARQRKWLPPWASSEPALIGAEILTSAIGHDFRMF